jgi:hypothetical protein
VLVVRFRIGDRNKFVNAKILYDEYMSRYGNRSDANSDSDTLELQTSLFRGPSTERTQQDRQRLRQVKRRPRSQTAEEREREVKIRRVIRKRLKGINYCHELDDEKVGIPPTWVARKCPRTYVEAYRQDQRWRHAINNEKWSISRRLWKS